MSALDPAALELPERLLAQLPPHPNGNLEDIAGDYAFDHLRAARILSAMVLADLLRAGTGRRLVAFADRQSDALTLPEVLQAVLRATWSGARPATPMQRSLRRVTERAALDAMMILGGHADATPDVRAVVLQEVGRLGQVVERAQG